ncbi:hypothetical protein ACXR2T_10100 [Leucobacter sp. HY1910]
MPPLSVQDAVRAAYLAHAISDTALAEDDIDLLIAALPPKDPGERGRGLVILNAAAQLHAMHDPAPAGLGKPPTPIQHFRRQPLDVRERYLDCARAVAEARHGLGSAA